MEFQNFLASIMAPKYPWKDISATADGEGLRKQKNTTDDVWKLTILFIDDHI